MKKLKQKSWHNDLKPGESGYIRLSREVANGIFHPDKSTQNFYHVVGCLLVLATPTRCTVEFKDRKYICNPGELITTYTELAQRARVEYTFLKRTLDKLEKENIIERAPVKSGYHIKLPHYEAYTTKFTPIGPKKFQPNPQPRKLTAYEQYEKEEFERNLAFLDSILAKQKANEAAAALPDSNNPHK